ncbi:Imm1 family immunity protein [Polyangium fumosum]|uniref:Immunity protein Imm1 n=1 Tax=Polyangium fumosum TaxID=889272 RepID=A0A4U1JE81_9BACT|nr:Imm1 family immunity protein [Polyangium fumosum]TKD09384.1 hypothetical protein E8A74_11690 [Polyangium fumosum]
MSAISIHGDSWRGIQNDEWQIHMPSWDDVDNAIRRLDAKRYTILTIQGPEEQHLAIGGGAGRYVVYATFDNYQFWNLLGDSADGGMVLLNAGGQEGDYPTVQVVGLQQARSAARSFFVDLKLEPSLQWEKQ